MVLEGQLRATQAENDARRCQVEELTRAMVVADAAHAAELAALHRDIATLKTRVDALLSDELEKQRSTRALEAELSLAGEFAFKLEAAIVSEVWPGATHPLSPVRSIRELANFVDCLDEDGVVAGGQKIPNSFFNGKTPRELEAYKQSRDPKAFVDVHSRWRQLKVEYPAVVQAIQVVKHHRNGIAHCHSPKADASPSSLCRELQRAYADVQQNTGGAEDERVSAVLASLTELDTLRVRYDRVWSPLSGAGATANAR